MIEYKITLEELPSSDTNTTDVGTITQIDITPPDDTGWTLEYSFKGNYNIFHVWKKGGIKFDGGFQNYCTSVGDDITNNLVGEGANLVLTTSAGQPTSTLTFEFIPEYSYIYGGIFAWDNASVGDTATLEIIGKATTLVTSGTLTLDVDSATNKVYYVGTGGTYAFGGNPTLVPNKTNTGYWDYNPNATNPLTPNTTNTGEYDIYNTDIVVANFLNKIALYPFANNSVELNTDNAWKVEPGYEFRLVLNNASNTAWTVSLTFFMIKSFTSNY